MMKFFTSIVTLLALTLVLSSCSNKPDITLDNEGYVVVDGVRTDYVADKDDMITVSVDGYLVVNGVRTDYKTVCEEHTYGEWSLYNSRSSSCEESVYYRVCLSCGLSDYRNGTDEDHVSETVITDPTCQEFGYEKEVCTICGTEKTIEVTDKIAHDYSAKHEFDDAHHWKVCNDCGNVTSKSEHLEFKNETKCKSCDHETIPKLIYSISDDGTYAEVTGYIGQPSSVVIEEEYLGLPVRSIAEMAFIENTTVKSLIVPESVTKIGLSAFSQCSSLSSVVIEGNNTVIDEQAFYSCSSLKNLALGEGTTEIKALVFSGCDALESVIIPSSVTDIGIFAFYSCNSLKKVTLPEGITEIKENTFGNCNSLESVNIPSSVKSIGLYAFRYAQSLTELRLPDNLESIGDGAFQGCTSLKELIIPISITSLGEDAFEDCSSLTAVYYGGDKDAWDAITTGYPHPSGIKESLIHFNSAP